MVYYFQSQAIVTPFRLSSNEPVFSADTITLKVRRVKQGAQRWEMEFRVVITDPADTFTDMVTNFHNTVTLEMPQLNSRGENIASGTCSTAVDVNLAHTTGEADITIQGMVQGTTINKGRFIKFANHDKIYLVTALTTGDASGQSHLYIYPSLRVAVPDETQIMYRDITDDITFTAYRDITNAHGITYTDGVLSDLGTINLIEAL